MHGWETRMLLKYYLERGVSKAELSRRFGVSRRTIHEWVETVSWTGTCRQVARATRRDHRRPTSWIPTRGSSMHVSRSIPGCRRSGCLTRSARRATPVATAGCGTTSARCVHGSRPSRWFGSRRRRGVRGQVDFATFTLPWGRRHALVVVLSHSRLLWLCFYRRQTMAVLTDGLERAFARFGGVPKELLFDQMRAVVLSDQRVGGGELVLNAEFLRFAAHWGFHPRACRPYRAQTKGKVERPIRYIRDSFFYGRAFANDEDLNEQASRWLEGTANVRRHGTTGERPVDRFERGEQHGHAPALLLRCSSNARERFAVRLVVAV